jgi:hypothetical protein
MLRINYWAIHAGDWLLKAVLMAVIVGVWRK